MVILSNANITKYVEGPISGNAGGYVAGTTGGTLYIVDSVLSEDGRGGVGGNYTVYASAGDLIVERSSIIQLGEDEGGYTSGIGEPGSNGGLLVYGYARANMSIGTSRTYYFDSYVETEGWAAMSTDAGRGVEFYSYNSTARAVNGGYGVYADNGCYDYMYGTALMGAEMGAIIAGGGEVHLYSTDYAGEELLSMQLTTEPTPGVRGLVLANRTGIMIHSPDEAGSGDNGNTAASVFEARGVDFVMSDDMDAYWQQNEFYDGETWQPDYQDYSAKYDVSVGEYIEFIRGAAILVKSTSANIDLEDVTFVCENGTSEGQGTMLMSVVNSDNHGRWVKASQDSDKIQGTAANIADSVISGDIKNYDYQRKMTVNLDGTEWTGALYTWDADTWDAAWSDECKAAERCLWILDGESYNRQTQGSILTLAGGSVWNVTDDSGLVSLTVEAGSSINGVVTVDGQVVDVSAGGSWTGDIVVSAAVEAAAEGDVPATDGTENQSNTLSETAQPATAEEYDAYEAYLREFMENYSGDGGDGSGFDDGARSMALGELDSVGFGADVSAFPFEMYVTQFGALSFAEWIARQ